MASRYPDFFLQLEHCLDRGKSRKDNYEDLQERYKRVRNQHSSEARIEQALLDQALKVFANEAAYRSYLDQARANEDRQGSRSKSDVDQARRREKDAHRRAQQAEAEKRREAELRKEVERQLEDEREARRQAEDAQREEQEPREQSSKWGDLLLKGLEVGLKAWAAKKSSTNQAGIYRPAVPDLTGVWRAADGHVCRINQDGSDICIRAWDPFGNVIADSSGSFDGRIVTVSFQTVPVPTLWGPMRTSGVAAYEVLNGGQLLQGRIQNHTTGQVANVQLYRAG